MELSMENTIATSGVNSDNLGIGYGVWMKMVDRRAHV